MWHLHKVLGLMAFVRTHPNLAFLWYKGRNFWAFMGDCRSTPIDFIRGIWDVGNWTPLDSFSFPLVLFSCRCHASRIRGTRIHNQSLLLVVTARTFLLISYFSFHQLWLPHNLRPWKQHVVWTIQRWILFTESCILSLLQYIQCATEENFMIIW